jgi:hypothetical protein
MLVVSQLENILKTLTTDNIENTTAVKTARVASLSGLKTLSFPPTEYAYEGRRERIELSSFRLNADRATTTLLRY